MDLLFIPAERVRPIERDGLFGTWDWDFKSGALSWSDGVFRLLGLEPGAVSPSYKCFLDCMHPEDRFGYELSGYDAVLDGRLMDSEFRIIRPNGTVRWVANKGEVFRDDDDQPYRAAGTLIDITARREAEMALQVSEERYRALVKAMAVAEWRATPNGFPVEITNWSALTGQSEEESRGLGWMHAIHPEDRERVRTEGQRCSAAGGSYEVCFRVRHADGSYRWVLGRAVPLRNSDGSIREWVGMIMDVHDRRAAEERLMIGEQRLREALRAGRVVAWEYDLSGHVVARSDNAMDVIGLGSEPLESFWGRVHPTDVERVQAAWRAAVEGGVPYDVEYRFLRPDGRLVWLASRGSVVRSLRTLSDRALGITFDITAQKAAEVERDDSAREDTSNQAHSSLAGSGAAPDSGRLVKPSIRFQPTRLAMRRGCEEGCLTYVEGCLAAVLVRLVNVPDEELENSWFLEVGFGPWGEEGLTFSTLSATEAWLREKCPADWRGT